MTTTDPARKLEALRLRSAEIADRLARLQDETDDAVAGDDDELLAVLIAERGALEAKASSIARSIGAARLELSEEGREQRRAEIERTESIVTGILLDDAQDAMRIEQVLDHLADLVERLHRKGADARRALHPLMPRNAEGTRHDALLLDDLDHRSGTLGRLIQSELVRRGLFRDLAPTVDAWPRRPADTTLSEHFTARAERQGRRVARIVGDALEGV